MTSLESPNVYEYHDYYTISQSSQGGILRLPMSRLLLIWIYQSQALSGCNFSICFSDKAV